MVIAGTLKGTLSSLGSLKGTPSSLGSLSGSITRPETFNDYYTGEYAVTPTTEMQVLFTSGKTMADNVTVNPIPRNYGLITWNGTTLTVS